VADWAEDGAAKMWDMGVELNAKQSKVKPMIATVKLCLD
jgi:hypothetical protein